MAGVLRACRARVGAGGPMEATARLPGQGSDGSDKAAVERSG